MQVGDDINGETAGDSSGFSGSLSDDGTTVAIGAVYNNGNNGVNSGHVRVYLFDTTSWVQIGDDIDGETEKDYSGGSVSLSDDGTTVAIGATGNDGNGTSSGHVRVYSFDTTSWVQIGDDIDGEALEDYSGRSVSLSDDGTIIAIGTVHNDGNGDSSGHVRVYSLAN